MCHGYTDDWYAERRGEFERADDETDEPDEPEYDDGMAGREVDEPAVDAPDFEEPDVDETPELDDEEQPAAAPSDD
jgi:hypothetical protein